MASPQTLQPVLKMKVDELFLFWLSEPSTQAMLKDYLNKIKNGEEIELSHGDFKGTSTLVLTENNNIASKINATERMTTALGAPCSPPSATLPSASGSNNRAGVNARALRRSVSTKKVKHPCSALSLQCSMTPVLSPCRLLYPGLIIRVWCLLFTCDSKFKNVGAQSKLIFFSLIKVYKRTFTSKIKYKEYNF